MISILVTNDDGVRAPGIRALFEAVKPLGRATVVAPVRDNSGVSHSLTLHRPVRARKLEEENFYSINGTPTDCVTIGLNKILSEKPGLLVSGINSDPNLGDDISYSGTVSAAIEGTMYGVPSLAFSLAGESPVEYEAAASIAGKLAKMVLQFGLPPHTLLNVNIPPLTADAIKGIRFTCQGRRLYQNAIQETFDPWGRKHYWIGGGDVQWGKGENTDEAAVREGYVSITPIQLDLTNHDGLDFLKNKWNL